VNYIETIKHFFVNDNKKLGDLTAKIYQLLSILKDQGFTNQDWSQEIIDEIVIGFLGSDVDELFKAKLSYYLTHLLKTLTEFDIPPKPVRQDVDGLKPSDFKAKEYDANILALFDNTKGEEDVRE